MGRDDFDIPEVFRRAMEEAGWESGKPPGDQGGGRPPLPPRVPQDNRPNRLMWLLAIGVFLLIGLNWLVEVYTDWLWFNEVQYQAVWLKQWGARMLVLLVGFVAAFLLLWVNWIVARRRALRTTPPFNPKFLQISGVRWLIVGCAALLAFGFASSLAASWEQFLQFVYRVPFGTDDPLFGQDVSFYLFELPVFNLLQQWIVALLVVALLGILGIYAVNYIPDIQRGTWKPQELKVLRQHVALLGGVILLIWAVGYGLSVYGLMYSPRGVVFGASYTDMNASLYALFAQMVLMLLTAVAVFMNIFRLSVKPVVVAGGLWLLATVVLGAIVPGFIQRYSVEPNEIAREEPYIAYNIEFTRMAYGLDKVQTQDYELGAPLGQADIDRNQAILQNIRLWDYRPLQETYTQLQALRPYYQFGEIDIDRYEIDGETRQVMLAARELNKANLPNQSWVNRNLEFTHGFGLVMNAVDEFTADGQPIFLIQDLPPQSSVDIDVSRPEVYYGELTRDVVYVGSDRQEFSFPSGNENVYSQYAGTGGIQLDSFLKRLAFAIRFADANVLLSDDIRDETRVQFYRQIQERIERITPFIELDGDPYIVVDENGRLVWLQDGYTTSSYFPYATPVSLDAFRSINYIRNALKITVDAYDGNVTYYLVDSEDPIIQTYARAFPGIFKPLAEMPASLQAHLRYPVDMFSVQMRQYLRYHMTDVRVFYNQEDVWDVPLEVFTADGSSNLNDSKQPMEPYFVTMPLPNETEPEYLLIQPYTPVGKDNMIAWLAARNDPPNYGELMVYELPKQELVFGPLQIEGRIDQEPDISQQFSLWDQGGSRVIRGNLLVIPMNGSFLYVEPVYLLSDTNALPELKRVIVATDTRIAMDTTLMGAIAQLLEERPGDVAELVEELELPADEGGDVEEGAPETAVTPTRDAQPTADVNATLDQLIESANAHFLAAEAAQRDGDWATYGAELEALQADLQQLLILTDGVEGE